MPLDRSPSRPTRSEEKDDSERVLQENGKTPVGVNRGSQPTEHAASLAEIQSNKFRNVKLSTFWRNRPKLWFTSLESVFTAYRVRSDDIKFSAVVRHLDEQTMLAVADILEQPPSSGKYEKLKSILIERFSDSLDKQLRKLLDGMELEDKTPSALLREMRTLAGANVTDNMLHTYIMVAKTAHEDTGALVGARRRQPR